MPLEDIDKPLEEIDKDLGIATTNVQVTTGECECLVQSGSIPLAIISWWSFIRFFFQVIELNNIPVSEYLPLLEPTIDLSPCIIGHLEQKRSQDSGAFDASENIIKNLLVFEMASFSSFFVLNLDWAGFEISNNDRREKRFSWGRQGSCKQKGVEDWNAYLDTWVCN
jgi:hypothetical protein